MTMAKFFTIGIPEHISNVKINLHVWPFTEKGLYVLTR